LAADRNPRHNKEKNATTRSIAYQGNAFRIMPQNSKIGLLPNLIGLGIFWGFSPIGTKWLASLGVIPFKTIAFSSLGVGLALLAIWRAIGTVNLRDTRLWLFGFGCAFMLNLPFGIGLAIIGHVPVSTYSIITSTTPLFGYVLALLTGVETFTKTRALAILLGFLGAAILVVDPRDMADGTMSFAIDYYLAIACALPLFYALYHLFAARFWPKGRDTGAVSIVESLAAGIAFLPLVFFVEGTGTFQMSGMAWLAVLAVTVLWIIERMTFFNIIRYFGPVSTVQAVNLATVASVILGYWIYSEPIDERLFVSGGLVLFSLWLNGRAERHRLSSEAPVNEASQAI
jgi:drug/metabolite transporter (DMT)-like permease